MPRSKRQSQASFHKAAPGRAIVAVVYQLAAAAQQGLAQGALLRMLRALHAIVDTQQDSVLTPAAQSEAS